MITKNSIAAAKRPPASRIYQRLIHPIVNSNTGADAAMLRANCQMLEHSFTQAHSRHSRSPTPLRIPTDGGTLDGLQLEGSRLPAHQAPTLVMVCPNACFYEEMLPLAAVHASWGCNVVLFNGRGIGRSEGTAHVVGDAVADMQAVLRHVCARCDNVGVWGWSLGAGLATEALARAPELRQKMKLLVSVRSFASLPWVAAGIAQASIHRMGGGLRRAATLRLQALQRKLVGALPAASGAWAAWLLGAAARYGAASVGLIVGLMAWPWQAVCRALAGAGPLRAQPIESSPAPAAAPLLVGQEPGAIAWSIATLTRILLWASGNDPLDGQRSLARLKLAERTVIYASAKDGLIAPLAQLRPRPRPAAKVIFLAGAGGHMAPNFVDELPYRQVFVSWIDRPGQEVFSGPR